MGALAMSETTAGSDVVAMKIKADKKGIDFQQFCFHPHRTPTSFTFSSHLPYSYNPLFSQAPRSLIPYTNMHTEYYSDSFLNHIPIKLESNIF